MKNSVDPDQLASQSHLIRINTVIKILYLGYASWKRFTVTALFCNSQKAQSKKGKSAEKSPQDELPPSEPSVDVSQLDANITEQGNKVRRLKDAKASKVSWFLSLFKKIMPSSILKMGP